MCPFRTEFANYKKQLHTIKNNYLIGKSYIYVHQQFKMPHQLSIITATKLLLYLCAGGLYVIDVLLTRNLIGRR